MSGRSPVGLPRITARCATDIKLAKGLTEFVRVTLERRDGEYLATPTGFQGSGVFSSMSRAEGLLIGPADANSFRTGDQGIVLLLTGAAGDEAFFERRLQKN